MKVQNTVLTKYEQVSKILDEKGYITDSELFKIWGDESFTYKSQEHIRRFNKLKSDRQFFADKTIVEKRKGHRCHLVRTNNQSEHEWYKVCKDFYNEILNEKDNS